MKAYTFISDPGHGWLNVKLDELRELGIADQITPYSYRDGDCAWLEEDCDLSTFIVARAARVNADPREWAQAFFALDVEQHTVRETHIRNLPRYSQK